MWGGVGLGGRGGWTFFMQGGFSVRGDEGVGEWGARVGGMGQAKVSSLHGRASLVASLEGHTLLNTQTLMGFWVLGTEWDP